MIQEELIKYETAVLARQKGFDEICTEFYDGPLTRNETFNDGLLHTNSKFKEKNQLYYICAPTQAHLQRWLREKHNIHIQIGRLIYTGPPDYIEYNDFIYEPGQEEHNDITLGNEWDSYEEALENALVEALRLIK